MSAFAQGRHRPAGSMRVHFVVKCRNRSFMSKRPSFMSKRPKTLQDTVPRDSVLWDYFPYLGLLSLVGWAGHPGNLQEWSTRPQFSQTGAISFFHFAGRQKWTAAASEKLRVLIWRPAAVRLTT